MYRHVASSSAGGEEGEDIGQRPPQNWEVKSLFLKKFFKVKNLKIPF